MSKSKDNTNHPSFCSSNVALPIQAQCTFTPRSTEKRVFVDINAKKVYDEQNNLIGINAVLNGMVLTYDTPLTNKTT